MNDHLLRILLATASIIISLSAGPSMAASLDIEQASVRDFIQRMETEHGLEPEAVRAVLAQAEVLDIVLERISSPSEGLPWDRYRNIFITQARIDGGVAFWEEWEETIASHAMVHESIRNFLDGFRWGSHTMGMLVSVLGAKSTFYPDSRNLSSPELMELHIARLVSKVATVAALCYRHSRGLPYIYPDASLGFCENFLNMLFNAPNTKYEPNPILVRALEVLFILHADHEQNCSTSTMRGIGSSLADPYSSIGGAAGALYGPLHGGANEAVLKMLMEIGDVKNVPSYIERVKNREVLLQGFGHRVYKHYDPRASIVKETADQVFEVTGRNSLIDIAKELERIALEDDFFVSRKLYPNVDFYSGIIYQAMGLPVDMYPVLFAIPRTAGWLAQWKEMMNDDEQKIARPRQVYTGYDSRDYVAMGDR